MDEETAKLYLENIEEYVFDEDRIVTYKWLSKALDVHVNTAKQLLYTFANGKSLKPEIQITYLVGGVLPNGQGCRFEVVPKDNLEKVKTHFKSVTSEHIYSVHKSKQLPDLNILYGIDSLKRDEQGNKIHTAICCKNSTLRLEEELVNLRLNARAATVCTDGKQWPKGPPSNKTSIANNQKSSSEESSHTNTTKTSGAIAAMFAAKNSKPKPENAKISTAAKMVVKNKSGSGITMFFNRQAEKPKPSSNTDKPEITPNSKNSKTSPIKFDGNVDNQDSGFDSKSDSQESVMNSKITTDDNGREHTLEVSSVKNDSEKVIKDSKAKSKRKQSDSPRDKGPIKTAELDGNKKDGKSKKANVKSARGKHKLQREEGGHPVKKRKRIVVMADSDSSDDDMFGREDETPDSPLPPECEPEPEPEPEPVAHTSDSEILIPSTPQHELNKGRKRKRKMVDKTFANDEGYIVTRKEYVYESCSESETEEKENESTKGKVTAKDKKDTSKAGVGATKEPPKKCISPQKAKQTTLMSFFKKN